ncbi:MAG: phosphatidylserine decarboxylase [Thermoplasmata archaeon]
MLAPGSVRWIAVPAAVGAFGFGVLAVVPVLWAVVLGFAGAAMAGFLAAFFRDPERRIGPGLVSAADGRIRAIDVEGDRLRISVFMQVTDVHVNRAPLAGTVAEVGDAGRGHLPAYRPEASSNRSRSYRMETPSGPVEIVQVTGYVARRLVSYVRPGATLAKGDRFGMIAFGSRVDVLVPASRWRPTVRLGERVRAGASTIAEEIPP